MNPGHAIETAWFIMAEAKRRNDKALLARALEILDWSLVLGWDEKYGGILYFVDIEGRQPVQYEWDMKLFWPHNEAIYATLLAYSLTGEQKYEAWFEKILKWAMSRFPDKKYGEWIGYLHRDGSVSHDLKGNMWKGAFHVPAHAAVLPHAAGGDARKARGVTVVLGVEVHMEIEETHERVQPDGAAAQSKVGHVVLEADVLGVVCIATAATRRRTAPR